MNKFLTKIASLDPKVIQERFKPDLTPSEMEELGVLAKQYYGKDPHEGNFFKVDASLTKWPEYWLNEDAPKGFYQWYQGYAAGKRTDDDLRQMRRWYLFKQRHLGGLAKADPSLHDLSVQPKRRQAMLNWGITGGLTKDELMKKKEELALKKQASIDNYVRHKYKEGDYSHLENPVASKKWDGAHFVLTVQSDGTFSFHSRRHSVKGGFPERASQLPHLTDKPMPEFAGNQFATELVHTGKEKTEVESHPTVSGILNSLPPRAISTQEAIGPVRAVLIDVKNPELPTYKDKIEYLQKFEKAFGKPDVMFTPHLEFGHENINKYLDKIQADKGEGLIVADWEKPESENVRYKVKNYVTYNLEIVDLQQEIDIKGAAKDSMGAFVLKDRTGRVVGKVGTGFDRATRIDAWKNPKNWIGKLIQVRAYPPSVVGGQIRFPVYNGFADGSIDKV